jgi:uncharacterized protein (TIGR03546 family)
MLSDSIALVRSIVRSLLAGNGAGQLAAGFTLGMIIGIMPKSNLIALTLCIAMFSLRCNKGLGLVTAIAFSFVGPWIDPFAHKVGLAMLGVGSLQTTYATVFNWPFGPWIGFNNTVVTGTLLIGLYVAYPTFWFTRLFFRGVERAVGKKPATSSTPNKHRARIAA